MSACCGGWQEEFAGRGIDFDVPESIIRMEALADMSWHNDACPSFGTYVTEAIDLRIWCDAPNPDERESGADHRFQINGGAWDDEAWAILRAAGMDHLTGEFPAPPGSPVPELGTDDPEVAVRLFITVLAHLQAAASAAARSSA